MKKKPILKITFLSVAAIIIVFLVIVAMQPSEFRVTRSATITAAPQAVFPHVNELRKWDAWSPWMKLDPNAKGSYEGPPAAPPLARHRCQAYRSTSSRHTLS